MLSKKEIWDEFIKLMTGIEFSPITQRSFIKTDDPSFYERMLRLSKVSNDKEKELLLKLIGKDIIHPAGDIISRGQEKRKTYYEILATISSDKQRHEIIEGLSEQRISEYRSHKRKMSPKKERKRNSILNKLLFGNKKNDNNEDTEINDDFLLTEEINKLLAECAEIEGKNKRQQDQPQQVGKNNMQKPGRGQGQEKEPEPEPELY